MDWAALQVRWAAGDQPPLLPFWGHRPERDGSVGAGCLSQWWPSPFEVDGQLYLTAEHWMMAGKARLFGDDEALDRILTSVDPGAAKQVGRQVRGFVNEVWEEHRVAIVGAGNRAKFAQHEAERAFLLGTGEAVLVEASPYDRIWGIGLKASDRRAQDPRTWRGRNLLGFALMAVREALAAEAG